MRATPYGYVLSLDERLGPLLLVIIIQTGKPWRNVCKERTAHKMKKNLLMHAVGAGFIACAFFSHGQTNLVVPAGLETHEANGASSSLSERLRLQEVYGAADFPANVIRITGLRLRPSVDFGTG